jgi:ornithine carbamoyltransferase
MKRHLLSLFEVTPEEILSLCRHAAELKAENVGPRRATPLQNRVLGLVFEKPSLRTRVSFQAAMGQLGGTSVYLSGVEAGFGTRESIADIARVMSEYVDVMVLRTFSHRTIEEFANLAACPVINGLSNDYHPCQALADLFTIREHFGDFAGKTLAFVGDGNNMARSLAIGCAQVGINFHLAAPEGYGFDAAFLQAFQRAFPKVPVPHPQPVKAAVARASVIYTDVWTSMGQEAEQEQRKRAFATFQIDDAVLAAAPGDAVVMHCLPAHRGEEVTASVIDGPRSIVFTQAANRLHLQKALLLWLLGLSHDR